MAFIVSVSGYNGSGKSTLVRHLSQELQRMGRRYRLMRFDKLYPSGLLLRKRKRTIEATADGGISLRAAEAQKGGWNRRFRVIHFANLLSVALIITAMRVIWPRTIVIFDRYFFDRLAQFDYSNWLCRLTMRLLPNPNIGFVLLPEMSVLEQRLLSRCEKLGATSVQFSEADRQELNKLRERYKVFCTEKNHIFLIDSSNELGNQQAGLLLSQRLNQAGPQA